MLESSWATSDATRRSMQGNRGRDTGPELAVRSAVHSRGLRYRVNTRPLPELRRTADLVFSRPRVAVFVDGCWWHGCEEHYSAPRANADYWHRKVESNRRRDADTNSRLQEAGWIVLRFWEHDDPEQVATQVEEVVRPRG